MSLPKPIKTTKYFFALAAIIPVIFIFWFFQKNTGQKPQNVILISIDTCRADYLSCYGYSKQTTPNIDEIARQGIVFSNAISPVPITLPAHASMLTGTIPPYHGVHDNVDFKLGQLNVTLPEILKTNGFTTAAIVSAYVLDRQFGLDQGFDTYNDKFEEVIHSIFGIERRADETSRFAIEWLEENKSENFFLFLHYYDPHVKYDPPEPFASSFSDNFYAGEIAYVDHYIGKVIDKLKDIGLYDSSLIVITGDHGEMLGEHGETEHSYFIYQSAVKVPLIFKPPGWSQPRRIGQTVGLIDIVPTICSVLKIEMPAHVQGEDLSYSFSADKVLPYSRHLYCETMIPTKYGASSLLGIVTDQYKYIQSARPELYDLIEDAGETNNLIDSHSQQGRILQDKLKSVIEEAFRQDSEGNVELDEEALARLESLGYVAGSLKDGYEFDDTSDSPKDVIGFHESYKNFLYLDSEQKYAEAEQLCRELAAERPEYIRTNVYMARKCMEKQDFASAVPYLQQLEKLRHEPFEVHFNLAVSFTRLGKLDMAVNHYLQAIEIQSRPELHVELARVLVVQNKLDQAINNYKKFLTLSPDHSAVQYELATICYRSARIEEAINFWQEILQSNPDNLDALNDLAWVKATESNVHLRDPDEAVRLAQRACELTKFSLPNYLDTLGAAYASAGKFSDAVETAQKAIELANTAGRQDLAENIVKHLLLYEQGKPYCAASDNTNIAPEQPLIEDSGTSQ